MGKHKTKLRPHKAKSVVPVWFIVAGMGIILVAVFAFFSNMSRDKLAVEVTGAPKIKVDQDLFNYGDVKLGLKPVRTVVRVTNVGDQILKFREPPYLEVLEGCWPPVPAISSMALKPGESTTVTMEIFMHGDMGGLHNFELHLLTNDPAEPDKTVSIISNWVD